MGKLDFLKSILLGKRQPKQFEQFSDPLYTHEWIFPINVIKRRKK